MDNSMFYQIRPGVIINLELVLYLDAEITPGYNSAAHVQFATSRIRLNHDEIQPLAERLLAYTRERSLVINNSSTSDPSTVARFLDAITRDGLL